VCGWESVKLKAAAGITKVTIDQISESSIKVIKFKDFFESESPNCPIEIYKLVT
jgi:hypothetical protein